PTSKTGDDERRARRAASQEVFDELAEGFLSQPGVNRGLMFGSWGLRWGEKFFAFVGRAGDLVVKLPEEHAAGLVARDEASAVKAGRNPTREWVSVPLAAAADASRWRKLVS